MSRLLTVYRNILAKYPISSQAIQTGFLMGTGDVIAQVLVEKRQWKDINVIRTGQFCLVGVIFVGPPLRLWYGVMDKAFGRKGKIVAIKKVAADQLLFAPCFIAFIMSIVGLVRGNSFDEISKQVTKDYKDVLVNNYKVWPGVQLMNFYIIPLQYQVLVVQIVAIFWNTYLSWKMNQNMEPKSVDGLT